LLSSWGVKFEGVDVAAEPARRQDLTRLGIALVPATVVGDRFVHGWNPAALADLVGIRYDEGERLSPDELARRLDRILAANQRAVRQIPREHLGLKHPERDRSVRELAFHIFRLGAAFVDCREQGQYPEAWIVERPPATLDDGEALARYGQEVRDRLAAWFRRPGWCDGTVHTYYGSQPAYDLMERTTWHTAQHLRQMYWFLDRMGVEADVPLTDADFKGLPIPKEVWS
jgi:DinB superfamily